MHAGSVDGDEASGKLGAPMQGSESDVSDPHFLPVNATKLVQSLIGLSDEQRQVLDEELKQADGDALLVLALNPQWQGPYGPGTVCDAIATFEMTGGARRDSGAGCHRWIIIHFDRYQDLGRSKTAIKAAHREAFALSLSAVTGIVAAGAVRAKLRTEPLADGTVVNKIAVRQEDRCSSRRSLFVKHFFYL